MKILVLKPKKEYIIKRKANKTHHCHECKTPIPKNAFYIEDHISYIRRKWWGDGYLWWHTHKVCLTCWRGPLP